MSNFDVNKWNKQRYMAEAGLNESKAEQAATAIDNAIASVDESLSFKDFALAVAKILKDEYGAHNFNPFMEVLHAELGMNESLNEAEGGFADFISKLEADPDNKYLKFIEKGDEIRVGGRQGDLQDFIIKYEEQDLGPYKLFSTDDDDRGLIVRISKK
jgi:hypothetical protein